jgi:hypothetical protein
VKVVISIVAIINFLKHQVEDGLFLLFQLSGSIVLSVRGDCDFTTKAEVAQSEGAAALVVINDKEGWDLNALLHVISNPQSYLLTTLIRYKRFHNISGFSSTNFISLKYRKFPVCILMFVETIYIFFEINTLVTICKYTRSIHKDANQKNKSKMTKKNPKTHKANPKSHQRNHTPS